MTDLVIGRLTATAPADSGLERSGSSIRSMLQRLADHRLDDELDTVILPPGDWCVRRLDVRVRLDSERPASAVETEWARAIVEALVQILDRRGATDVVHYRNRAHALNDLVSSLSRGRADNAWAWRQVGLTTTGDPDPNHAATDLVLAVCGRMQRRALAAVLCAVREAGITAVHRMLGERGWVKLADLVAPSIGSVPESLPSQKVPGIARPLMDNPDRVARPDKSTASPPAAGLQPPARRVRDLLADSELATALRRSGLRPTPAIAHAWSILVAMEADPPALRRADAAQLISTLATTWLVDSSLSSAGLAGVTSSISLARRLDSVVTEWSRGGSSDRWSASEQPLQPVDPDLPTSTSSDATGWTPGAHVTDGAASAADNAENARADVGWTAWAGLPFMLATAGAVDIPDRLLDDPELETRSVRWLLHELAQRLVPAGADDPGVLACAGLAPLSAHPTGPPPTKAEHEALAMWARRWSEATAVAVDRLDENPADVVTDIAQRHGWITGERGWIEIHLRLDEVDVDVRRAGFDLDLGWVAWLGAVVRFVYA